MNTSIIRLIIPAMVFMLCATGCKKDPANNGERCQIPRLSVINAVAFENPCAIAVSNDGKIAITTYNGFENGYGSAGTTRVWRSYEAWSKGDVPPILPSFQNIAAEAAVFDNAGNLYIAETEQVAGIAVYLNQNENFLYSHTIHGNFNNPRGMVFDKGTLWIADDGNKRVVSVRNPQSPNYQVSDAFSTNGSVKAVTADNAHFYYVQYDENRVVKRNKSDGGETYIQVASPVDISLHDGNLYVASPSTHHLTVISSERFSNECMGTFENFDASYASAYYQGVGLLLVSHDEDEIKTLAF